MAQVQFLDTSEICSLTVTLADKDNPSSDALLPDNSFTAVHTLRSYSCSCVS